MQFAKLGTRSSNEHRTTKPCMYIVSESIYIRKAKPSGRSNPIEHRLGDINPRASESWSPISSG